MYKSIATALIAAASTLGGGVAHAANISWSIGINTPFVGTVISNAAGYPAEPVYYAEPAYRSEPVYYTAPAYRPEPVYYAAPVYRSDPVYYAAPVYRSEPRYHAAPVYRSEPAYSEHRRAPAYAPARRDVYAPPVYQRSHAPGDRSAPWARYSPRPDSHYRPVPVTYPRDHASRGQSDDRRGRRD